METKEWNLANVREHVFYTNNELMIAFNDFLSLRKKKKKPTTERGELLLMLEVIRLSNGNADTAIKIIDKSIAGSWLGFVPLNP